MRQSHMRGRLGLVPAVFAVVAALVVVILGQGTNPANLLPRLTSSSSDSKTLYVDFVSVVNLPLGARVLSRGTQIGTLESIDLVPGAARLRLGVKPQVRLPVETRAELRQSTLLGDIYVALVPPADHLSGPYLESKGLIPLDHTDPGPQVEDILHNLADFMAGGSVMRVQDAIRKVNQSVDIKNGDLPAASRTAALDIRDLEAGTNHLDSMIDSLNRVAGEAAADPQTLAYTVGPEGQASVGYLFQALSGGFALMAGTSRLASGLTWLQPRLAQLNPFLGQLVPLLRSYSPSSRQLNGNLGELVDVVRDKLVPFSRDGGVSINKVTTDGQDVTVPVTAVLRMIGALQ